MRAVEIIYIRGACGMSRLNLESNEKVSERFSMSAAAKGVDYGVAEYVKRNSEMVWTCDKNG